MMRTCHLCHGHSHDYDEANLKRCAGCQKVYYCTSECQKDDWVEHIFECKPKRPINTADYLALAVRKNLFPEHPQTCIDYGFHRVIAIEDQIKLFGLYIGLIKVLKVPPKRIHDWRVRGVLVDEIKATFFKIPEHTRGGYFPWFLENQHVIALAGLPLSSEMCHQHFDAMTLKAWWFIGGKEDASPEEIRAAIERKPEEERECFYLYVLLHSKLHPGPSQRGWVDFGFAACTSQEEEMELGVQYKLLTDRCTFSHFCEAYRDGRLLDLFDAEGMKVGHREHFTDVVCGLGKPRKSVWYLKAFALQEDDDENAPGPGAVPAVVVDYGFRNCKNASERRQLRRVYKAFFELHNGNPLALHEAAIRGDLHGFLSEHVQGLRDPKFRRLMRNPYPLPDL